MTNDTIDKLSRLGFSSYEAKAYYALLQKSPAIGYEVSKIAKIPTAKIYEVLSNLKNKEVIVASSSEPVYYMPIPPEMLLNRLRQGFLARIEELNSDLIQVQPRTDVDFTWNLKGYKTLVEKMVNVIESAGHSLLVSLWPDEMVLLGDGLVEAEKRGVDVIAAIFGECDAHLSQIANIEECGVSSHKRLGKHLSVVVGDSNEVVIGEIGDGEETYGIRATTPCIVLVAKEYIKHDIWGHFLIETLGDERFKTLIDNNHILSSIINNR